MKARFAVALLAIAMLCASTLAQENNTAGYWIEKAEELSQNSSFVDASNAYEKALQIDPDNATIWHRQAFLLTTIGKENESTKASEKALSLLDESLERDPQDADVWNQKALVLLSLGRPDECLPGTVKGAGSIQSDP